MNRPSLIACMLRTAQVFASRSSCGRLQVGAVIANEDLTSIDAVGYNGGAKGLQNDCESLEPGKCGHLHAEFNCIIKGNYSLKNRIMFITDSPCPMCAKAIINAGIAKVYFLNLYRSEDGIAFLRMANIKVIQWDLDRDEPDYEW